MCPVLHLYVLFITDQYQKMFYLYLTNIKKYIRQAILVGKCCHCRINIVIRYDFIQNMFYIFFPIFHCTLSDCWHSYMAQLVRSSTSDDKTYNTGTSSHPYTQIKCQGSRHLHNAEDSPVSSSVRYTSRTFQTFLVFMI